MQKSPFILLLVCVFICSACNKDTEPDGPILPAGATAYTETEIAFVPYAAGEQVFKKSPDFTEELVLSFKERLATKELFAWDQSYLTLSSDPFLEIELRLRYLQAENESFKTLAIYMPYRDDASFPQTNIFETPITEVGIETGFFSELVTYHPTIDINGVEWLNVYEISPLTSTAPEIDNLSNYSKVYYNSTFGIIELDQKNGDEWILHP